MCTEFWVEVHLWFSQLDGQRYKRLLLSVIKTTIHELERSGDLISFHFLFEPEPHALFWIRLGNEAAIDKTKQMIKKNLEGIRDFAVSNRDEELFGDYQGESEHFGEDGWQLAQKMFDVGTRLAIARVDPEFKKSKGFDVGKIVHCMMNPKFGQLEYNFYLEQYIGRVMLARRKNVIDAEVQREVKQLLDAKLRELEGAQFQTL